jgi:surface carbohydrate biosynthesis protein
MSDCQYKVCLIVDNPIRDLEGIVLLAMHLVEKGCQVYLVPMYQQGYEIPIIRPDFVLMNYARKVNSVLINNYKKAGINIGVLDTEGGIWETSEQYVESISWKESGGAIDLFLLWGEEQKKALIKLTNIPLEQVLVTGCPRYDYCYQPWIKYLQTEEVNVDILVVTNFTLRYPRFSKNYENEINNMVDSGYERAYMEERVKDDEKGRSDVISVVELLSISYPEKQIVIRPHPFEDSKEYRDKFSSYQNVIIEREKLVSIWLSQASITLHMNSSVAIESYMMKKKIITLDWINSGTHQSTSPLTLLVSEKASSYQNLIEKIDLSFSRGKKLTDWSKISSDSVVKWFYKMDGKASNRAASAIFKNLKDKNVKTSKVACQRMFWYGSKKNNIKGWVEALSRTVLGYKFYNYIRSEILARDNNRVLKGFKADQVSDICIKLNKVYEFEKKVMVSQHGASVKLS